MRRMLPAVVILALAAALAPAAAGRPRTLAVTPGPIAAFAQDGGRVAWAGTEPGSACPWRVRVLTLATGARAAVNRNGGPTCRDDIGFQPESVAGGFQLALAGRRAIWTLIASGNLRYVRVMTASLANRADVQLEELVYQYGYGEGDHLGSLAGDGPTLVYSRVATSAVEVGDCFDLGTCETPVVGGGLARVAGRATVPVPGAPPAVLVAVSGRHAALVPAAQGGESPSAAPGGPVEIRDATTGALVASFAPAGLVTAVALSSRLAAVLVETPGGTSIEWYDPVTGAPLGSLAAPGAAPSLSAFGELVVFRSGRNVRLLDAAAGTARLLARAAATPIGLSIEGGRVAWAENVRGRGRVRAVSV